MVVSFCRHTTGFVLQHSLDLARLKKIVKPNVRAAKYPARINFTDGCQKHLVGVQLAIRHWLSFRTTKRKALNKKVTHHRCTNARFSFKEVIKIIKNTPYYYFCTTLLTAMFAEEKGPNT